MALTPFPLLDNTDGDSVWNLAAKQLRILSAVVRGDVGFLVRGNVNTAPVVPTTSTNTGFTSGLTASQTLLAAAARKQFTVFNGTGQILYYNRGAAAATIVAGGYSVAIPAAGSYTDISGWQGEVTFICGATATGSVNVSEVV